MRDLLLWRLLGEDPLPPARVTPLLRELAGLPLRDRFPFFGRLPRALNHPDVSLRAAAASALSGAHGPLGWPWLVAALNDPAEEVRLAAVEALRESASQVDPFRW